MRTRRIAAVTGASGYLGSRTCAALESNGWEVVRLVRSPGAERGHTRRYELGAPLSPELCALLESTDVLVHAAYDFDVRHEADIRRVNVDGTRRVLNAAKRAGVRRIVVLSSMSAYEGTTQLYGRAKLDIEALTAEHGGCAVRPGLVYGADSGGMAGALRKLAQLPIVPLVGRASRLYTVRENDLMTAIVAVAASDALPASVISVAHPVPVPLRQVMTALAGQEAGRRVFVTIPWQFLYALLRAAELARLQVPFRSDSLLGLVRRAPRLLNEDALTSLGISLRPIGPAAR